MDLAQGSKDPKAISLVPALLNNHGWDLHDMGRFEDASSVFEQAHGAWRERGRPGQIHVARWSVAHCLRSLGRHAEALAILRELEAEGEAGHAPDPFVFDELAENLTALGDTAAAGVAQERAADLRKESRPKRDPKVRKRDAFPGRSLHRPASNPSSCASRPLSLLVLERVFV